tara:strand:+ start:3175 stop:3528 length:354 start_codon:yes stop_codon:yes gene_type:complete
MRQVHERLIVEVLVAIPIRARPDPVLHLATVEQALGDPSDITRKVIKTFAVFPIERPRDNVSGQAGNFIVETVGPLHLRQASMVRLILCYLISVAADHRAIVVLDGDAKECLQIRVN